MDFEGASESNERLFSRAERIAKILEKVDTFEPAENARAAYDQIVLAFDEIEGALRHDGSNMGVDPLEGMTEIPSKNGSVRWSSYVSNVLIIAHNGAIEVRKKDRGIPIMENVPGSKKIEDALQNLKLLYAKAGADGKGVWE